MGCRMIQSSLNDTHKNLWNGFSPCYGAGKHGSFRAQVACPFDFCPSRTDTTPHTQVFVCVCVFLLRHFDGQIYTYGLTNILHRIMSNVLACKMKDWYLCADFSSPACSITFNLPGYQSTMMHYNAINASHIVVCTFTIMPWGGVWFNNYIITLPIVTGKDIWLCSELHWLIPTVVFNGWQTFHHS